MKSFSLILAFLFFALAIIPCGDKDNCEESRDVITASALSYQHQDTQDEEGLCSPLCICHCCGGVTIIYEQPVDFAVNHSSVKNSIYSESSISEVAFSIWQPPKNS